MAHEFRRQRLADHRACRVFARSRTVAAGTANGHGRLLYVTSERVMAQTCARQAEPIEAWRSRPKGDGLLAAGPRDVASGIFSRAIRKSRFATLFRPVWYEGYPAPSVSWQSSSGSDAFEPKFGLMPLIFGTLKGTVYSMLFAVPLAILAAIYTSEFLNPQRRGASSSRRSK